MRATLTAICGFTMLASAWLFVMLLVLRHPGFEWRAALALGFIGIGMLTLAGVWHPQPGIAWRVAMAAGAIALGAAGVWAMKTNVDEGFVDVISLALMLQAILTLGYLAVRARAAVRTLS
jgi:hypothetical protein